MRVSIIVKTNNVKNEIRTESDGTLLIKVRALPHEGKANEAVLDLLSKHFKTNKSSIHIINGLSSKRKVIEIDC